MSDTIPKILNKAQIELAKNCRILPDGYGGFALFRKSVNCFTREETFSIMVCNSGAPTYELCLEKSLNAIMEVTTK